MEPRGARISESEDGLWRQVNPIFVDNNGELTSQVFRPGSVDEGLLSTHWARMVDAPTAYKVHTEVKGKQSSGVLLVTVGEVGEVGSDAYHDPEESPPDTAHSVVDFRGCARKETERRAKKLLAKAQARGWQHPARMDGSRSG